MRVIRLQLSPAQKAKLRKGVAIRLAKKIDQWKVRE